MTETPFPFMLLPYFKLFAIITPALITWTFADVFVFGLITFFMVLFILFIYTPCTHDLHPDGLFFQMGY
jgi:Amt family ammonium transporter